MKKEHYDVAVVGAGAAGLTSAIAAARSGPVSVLLLDGREVIGAKILMSGGTRCNVTHVKVALSDYCSETPRTVRNVLNAFTADKTLRFFKELGVELILEETGKYFPATHSAATVLHALVEEVRKRNVQMITGVKITEVRKEETGFVLTGKDGRFQAQTVILCTGGLSFPSTGSDGIGYGIAESLGHTRIETSPSLTPLLTSDAHWKPLSGLTLDCRLELWAQGRKQAEFKDSFLFTHIGFSGPAALNISRHWLRAPAESKPEIRACFLPQFHENSLREKILGESQTYASRSVKRWLSGLLPDRLADVLLRRAGIPESLTMNQCTREHREALIRQCLQSALAVSGTSGYAKAEVTAGGIDLREVDPRTLESLKVPGLFFAGEIVDVDGRIGGFNFQWAWASGHAAGQAAAKKILAASPPQV